MRDVDHVNEYNQVILDAIKGKSQKGRHNFLNQIPDGLIDKFTESITGQKRVLSEFLKYKPLIVNQPKSESWTSAE